MTMAVKKDKKVPLWAHFAELRRRLIVCALSIVVMSFVSYFFRDILLDVFVRPLYNAMQRTQSTNRLIYTGVAEGFVLTFKVSLLAGFILSLPIIGYHLYQFTVPALFPHERRAFMGFVVGAPVLFLIGSVFAYFIVLPLSYVFFLDYQTVHTLLPIQLEAKISEYISLTLHILTAFGLAFEMPLVLLLLGKAGVLTSQTLMAQRRVMVVVIFVIAAVLTPPDVISQVALAVPLLLLYELSVYLLKRREKLCTI